MAVVPVSIKSNEPVALISAAQDLTSGFVDLGGEIATGNLNNIVVFLNVDINSSANVRIKALAKHTLDHADEFSFPIKTISTSDVKVEAEYIELNVDADQLVALNIELEGGVPFVQLQVMAGTVGATAGQIDSAMVVRGAVS